MKKNIKIDSKKKQLTNNEKSFNFKNYKSKLNEEQELMRKIIIRGGFKLFFNDLFDTAPKSYFELEKYGKPKLKKVKIKDAKVLIELLQTFSLQRLNKMIYRLNLEIYLESHKVFLNITNNMIITSKDSVFIRYLWQN